MGSEFTYNDVGNNQRATIVKEIAHINFTALTALQLAQNQLRSIEGLPRLHIPHLEKLFLHGNNINSVGVVKKAAWPALQVFNISDNYLRDGKSLIQGHFPQIRTLYVYSVGEDKNPFSEQCFPAKMRLPSLQNLCIEKNEFCFGRSIERVLQQKWLHDIKLK